MIKKSLSLGIILLFIFSAMSTLGIGYDKSIEQVDNVSGPMDSPWPMSCHDNRHTGRSPYSTANNPGIEKWRFPTYGGGIDSGPVIDDNNIIYFGSLDTHLYALYPDGNLKWKYKTNFVISSTPAIDEDGTIYIGSWDGHFYAINSDGTLKWKFSVDANIDSSPAISDDGTVYFGTLGGGKKLYALDTEGNEKWHYQTGLDIASDPAIDDNGVIYFGSLDNYLYAIYPNGTLKWRFETGDKILGDPSIADDGTIYFGSFDDKLYALNPDGTEKWSIDTGFGTSANPSIGIEGTIYVGSDKLYAINPDGTIKWSFDLGPDRWIGFSSPAISIDGTIYIGTHIGTTDGGEIIAINSDSTESWRSDIISHAWIDSSPCIGEDGTVYIGSNDAITVGYLHAFGTVTSNEPPEIPVITGTTNGKAREEYKYTFSTNEPDNNPISFYIEWGDGMKTRWTRKYASNEDVGFTHTYLQQGTYTIRAKAKDDFGGESDWAELTVSMPRYKTTSLLYWFLEEHPIFRTILERVLFD